MTISDEMLAAYVDGELGPTERQMVDLALANDEELRERLTREQRLRAELSQHFAPVAIEPVPDRFAALLLGTDAPPVRDNVVSLVAVRQKRALRFARPMLQNIAALAATLVLGIAVGHFGSAGTSSDVMNKNGQLVAQGTLAAALSTQLAATQAPVMPVHIGVSFHDQSDRLCRTFDDAALSGIACRSDGTWGLVHTITASPKQAIPAYAQAGSTSPAVMQAAQAMMKGDPLDAQAEKQALQIIATSKSK